MPEPAGPPDPADPFDPDGPVDPVGPVDPFDPDGSAAMHDPGGQADADHPGGAERIADRPGNFSDQLEDWLGNGEAKTIGDLGGVFGEKSFAVTILLLMFLPALPIPTAGISDLFAAITVLVAVQLVAGRSVLWLPKRVQQRELGALTLDKAVPFIARRIRFFERFSRPRCVWVFQHREPMRLVGLAVIACALGTIFSPPFSGLDTLPAMGAVAIALGIILEDVVVFVVGTVIGTIGIALIVFLGAAAVEVVGRIF